MCKVNSDFSFIKIMKSKFNLNVSINKYYKSKQQYIEITDINNDDLLIQINIHQKNIKIFFSPKDQETTLLNNCKKLIELQNK